MSNITGRSGSCVATKTWEYKVVKVKTFFDFCDEEGKKECLGQKVNLDLFRKNPIIIDKLSECIGIVTEIYAPLRNNGILLDTDPCLLMRIRLNKKVNLKKYELSTASIINKINKKHSIVYIELLPIKEK